RCTEPDAFLLQVFFNAQPLNPQQQKDKQRAVNALIPSLIAYSGGQTDFTVDLSAEYATRLLIIKGNFKKLSLAVYGTVVSDSSPSTLYEPKPLPALDPTPLSKAVDPGNFLDPSELAKKLLSLIPDSPSLSLVIRLMFCLKPSNEDWDHSDFPYIHAYIDRDDEAFDLESIVQNLSRPLPEDTTIDVLEAFVTRVVDLIGPKNSDQAYYIAKLLSISASQSPAMSKILLQKLDLDAVFDSNILEEATVHRLLDAAANVDIAHHFNNPSFLDMLADARDLPGTDKSTQYAFDQLVSRVHGWALFGGALSNTQGDYYPSARMMRDIGTAEPSFGIWLESMIINEDVSGKLAENPLPSLQALPPLLLSENVGSISHEEFVIFVRAFVGVASVLAVWAWADSIGNDACRAKSLAILHLWQNVSGYREIVNHLLLLRQLSRRLGWITSDNPVPRNSSILAERVLFNLAQDPQAVLHDDFIETILSLKPPLSYIAEAERLTMRKVALVAEDGLSAALEEIAFKSHHPLSLRRLRTLRVSLAVIVNNLEMEERGEWHVLDTYWLEQKQDMKIRLIEIVLDISRDLNAHFPATSTVAQMSQAIVEQLFRTFEELLGVLMRLTLLFPLNVRSLRTAVEAIADVFACTNAADTLFSQSSMACIAAQETRQTCLEFLRSFSEPGVTVEPDKLGAEVIMRTLLIHVTNSSGRDPVNHVLQIFAMIDFLVPLPEPREDIKGGEPSHWVTPVLPSVLNELKSFLPLLDVENRVHLLKRLIKLDEGVVGIGEWLLTEETKRALAALDVLSTHAPSGDMEIVVQYDLHQTLSVLNELVKPESNTATWCLEAIASTDDLSRALSQFLMALLEKNYTCQPLASIIKILAEKVDGFVEGLRRIVLLGYLRVVQLEGLYLSESMQRILVMLKSQTLTTSSDTMDPLHLELSRLMSGLAEMYSIIDATLAEEVVAILEWFIAQVDSEQEPKHEAVLYGLTTEALLDLYDAMRDALSIDTSRAAQSEALSSLRQRLTIKPLSCEADKIPPPVTLPDSLQMPLGNLEYLLKRRRSEDKTPSTPRKASKTPDLLGVVISPPLAILRSPAATGLTKTYVANDFRALRQVPSSRLNTSRLPSMHGKF
ncbi:hypothetical protein JOM56_008836, partial [Amanita muscaria]